MSPSPPLRFPKWLKEEAAWKQWSFVRGVQSSVAKGRPAGARGITGGGKRPHPSAVLRFPRGRPRARSAVRPPRFLGDVPGRIAWHPLRFGRGSEVRGDRRQGTV